MLLVNKLKPISISSINNNVINMKIGNLSIVVGTAACNARCPFCVARTTGCGEVPPIDTEVNLINLRKACLLARQSGVTTVRITSKGEPTLFPANIASFLEHLREFNFPFIELQTNGLAIGRMFRDGKPNVPGLSREALARWRELGLDTIALSVVDINPETNAKVYGDNYPDLANTIAGLRELGFTVRLCVMMMRGGVDSPESLQQVIDFCRKHDVSQLTIRPLRRPQESVDKTAATFVDQNAPVNTTLKNIDTWLENNGHLLMNIMHGGRVYDVKGQNVCLTDSLTANPSEDDIRQIIFYPDGRLTYDWYHRGAVLLAGHRRSANKN